MVPAVGKRGGAGPADGCDGMSCAVTAGMPRGRLSLVSFELVCWFPPASMPGVG
jgi:hypothetical protein